MKTRSATLRISTGQRSRALCRRPTRGRSVVSVIISSRRARANAVGTRNRNHRAAAMSSTCSMISTAISRSFVSCHNPPVAPPSTCNRSLNQVRRHPTCDLHSFLSCTSGDDADNILRHYSTFSIDWFTDNKPEAPLRVIPSKYRHGINDLVEDDSVFDSSGGGTSEFECRCLHRSVRSRSGHFPCAVLADVHRAGSARS